jgi:hypothetical protein
MSPRFFFKRLSRSVTLFVLGAFVLGYAEWYHSQSFSDQEVHSKSPTKPQPVYDSRTGRRDIGIGGG